MKRFNNKQRNNKQRWLTALLALSLLSAGGAFGQAQTGNLYGEAKDNTGSTLPGVTVELTGIGAPRLQVTDAQGQFRFLGLDPGQYSLRASLDGFSTFEYPQVSIRVGRNTSLEVTLSAAIEDVITVTAESPLLDERKITAGTTVSQIELEKIPTARDPWAVLNQTPGVLTDRINVGGNESGQQAQFSTPGTSSDENGFAVDGVIITDMTAVGSSPGYYDFDQFSELQITTGGSDVTTATAGVTLNLVTKRGSNTPRGSGRYFLTQAEDFFGLGLGQANADIEGDLAPGQSSLSGNQINEVVDFGFEAGGAFVQDKFWGWGSYGRNDIKQFAAGGLPDDTNLENVAIKLNGQLATTNSAVASWNRGDKQKFGRGAGPSVASEATLDQKGPTELWKLEDTHVFGSSFFLTGLFSHVDGGFGLEAKGGRNVEAVVGDDNVQRGSAQSGVSDRNTDMYQLDGSYFLTTGAINHELRFGGQYREFELISDFGWPGGRDVFNTSGPFWGNSPSDPGCQAVGATTTESCDIFQIDRHGIPVTETEYASLWFQDTLTAGRWTVNAGLRYDRQDGNNPAVTAPANPVLPELLPALSFAGNDAGFTWETISPRLGATYALGEQGRTLLRASYARFAEQLSTGDISRINPVGFAYAYYYFNDRDGDGIWSENEDRSLAFTTGFDPSNPTATSSPNLNDPSLDPPVTDELIFGLEHALLPELVVGANFTYRLTSDVLEEQRFVNDGSTTRVVNRDDFVVDHFETGTLPSGRAYSVPVYGLRDGLSYNGGRLLTNGDREIGYQGASLSLTKRLANRWMARGYLTYGEAEWDVPSSFFNHRDPTDLVGNFLFSGGDADGELYAEQSLGSGNKGDVFLQSGWSVNVNGLYQVVPDRPWGFNVAGNLTAREGFPLPYFVAATGGDGLNKNVQVVDEFDEFRTDDVVTFDLRLEKDFRLADNLSATFSLDAFNLFNDNTALQRERQLNGSRPDFLDETLSPRIYRFGFRVNWR